MKGGILVIAFITVLLSAAPHAHAVSRVYDVTAWIDTTDYLIIRGSTLQWLHNIGGSPAGTHLGPQPTVISSTLDGVAQMNSVSWNQVWTSPISNNPVSSAFNTLVPALQPSSDVTVSVSKLSGRGTPSILQLPSAANDYSLTIQFTDGFSGADFLRAQITVLPEPGTATLLCIVPIGFLLRRRCRQDLSLRGESHLPSSQREEVED